eukprot:1248490-Rhodomonas_salina.1
MHTRAHTAKATEETDREKKKRKKQKQKKNLKERTSERVDERERDLRRPRGSAMMPVISHRQSVHAHRLQRCVSVCRSDTERHRETQRHRETHPEPPASALSSLHPHRVCRSDREECGLCRRGQGAREGARE